MAFAGVLGSAGALISVGIVKAVLVDMTVVHVVQVTFMQVVGVTIMLDCLVSATASVLVIVRSMCLTVHSFLLFRTFVLLQVFNYPCLNHVSIEISAT